MAADAKIMCPVEETGKNSVSPSMMAIIILWVIVIEEGGKSIDNYAGKVTNQGYTLFNKIVIHLDSNPKFRFFKNM
jgi:hypothetical protein